MAENHLFFLMQDLETGQVSLDVHKHKALRAINQWVAQSRQYTRRETKWGVIHLVVDQQTGWIADTEVVFRPTYEPSYLEEIIDDILSYKFIKKIIRLDD